MDVKVTKSLLMTALITGSVMFGSGAAFAAESVGEFELDTIIVTATRTEKHDLDIAAETQVITRQKIENIGATNVQQLLQTVLGLVYQSKGPGGASLGSMTSKVSMRGVESGTLVLINGTPINYRGLYNLEDIPVDAIEQIEIVKGGGSVLYGSEATGGVINIITKKSMSNSIKTGFGNNGRQNHGFTTQAGKLGIMYKYDKWGDIGKVSDSKTVLSKPGTKDMYNVFNGSEKNNYMLSYRFSDQVDMLYNHGKSNSYFTYTFGEGYAANILDTARYNRKHDKTEDFFQLNFKDNNGLKGNIYYNKNATQSTGTDFLSSSGSKKGYPQVKNTEEKNLTYGYDIQKLWQEKHNNYLIGTTYQREEFEKAELGDWENKKRRNNFSVYASWETGVDTNNIFTLSARETWTTGANEDKNFDNFSGQAQFVHKMNDEQSLYLNVGQSFKMPSFSNMYSGGDASVIVGDPNLKPQKGVNYEVGYKYDTGSHKYKAALFTTRIKDEISFSKSGDKYYAINEDFKNQGIELSAEIDGGNGWSYNYGLTYSDPKSKSNTQKAGVITDWRRTFGRVQLNSGVTYHKEKWTANLNANYLAERVLTTNTLGYAETKPYLLTTFNLRYTPDKNSEISLSMDNILDRQDNVNHSSSYYYSTPFTYLLSYTYKF